MKLMTIENNRKLSGMITIQPSKYLSHRYILASSLAKGRSEISPVTQNEDIAATIGSIEALGIAVCSGDSMGLSLEGGLPAKNGSVLDCNESGSTLRFLLPLPSVLGVDAFFAGKPELLKRPLGPYEELFRKNGVHFERQANRIHISGRLQPGRFELPGDISSQFISGLLFALPLLKGDSEIVMTSALESRGYVDMTLEVLRHFGITGEWQGESTLCVAGGQTYVPQRSAVAGDWAHAAFFLVGGAIGSSENLTLSGLNSQKGQDSQIVEILQEMGAKIEWQGEELRVSKSALHGIRLDGREIPDLIPVLAVAACAAEGKTHMENLGRLRYKESNRLEGLAEQLQALGAELSVDGDSLIINGKGCLKGGSVDSLGDHRLAMSLAIASLISTSPVVLARAGSVAKSAPRFWEEFKSLGGIWNE